MRPPPPNLAAASERYEVPDMVLFLSEMAGLLSALLNTLKTAVISGGNWPQFQHQLLYRLPPQADLQNLSLLPTCGTKFYQFQSDWQLRYSEDFTAAEKSKIVTALKQALKSSEVPFGKVWGELVEDRQSQITFSALGLRLGLSRFRAATRRRPNES